PKGPSSSSRPMASAPPSVLNGTLKEIRDLNDNVLTFTWRAISGPRGQQSISSYQRGGHRGPHYHLCSSFRLPRLRAETTSTPSARPPPPRTRLALPSVPASP